MSTALATFKRTHGVVAERNVGAGHRFSHRAYFERIRTPRGHIITALDYVTRYGMEALCSFKHAAQGDDETSACKLLAERNELPWPAAEPKKRKP